MADGIELAKAYVQIIPSAEGISGSISNVIEPEATSAGTSSGESLASSLASKFKTVLAGAGIATAVKSVINQVNATASAGDAIDKMSQKLGIASDQYQALTYMGEHCAISTGTFQTAVKKLQAQGYNGTLIDYLDSLMAIEDPTQRAASAQEMLGEKVANEIAPFLNGEQTMSDYYDQLESLGGMMSDDSVKACATYEDAMTDMNTAIDGVKNGLVLDFIPAISEVITGIGQLVSGDGEGMQSIINGFTELGTTFYQKGSELFSNLINGIIPQIPTFVATGIDAIGQFLNNIMAQAPTFISTGGNMLINLIDGLLDDLPGVIASAGTLVSTLVQGIGANLPSIVASAINIISRLLSTIASHLPQILQAGIQMLGTIASGIIQAIPKLVAQLPQVFNAIKNAFKSIDWLKLGTDVINGIKNGIKNGATAIMNAARDVAKSALNAAKNFLGIHSPSRVFRDQIGKMIPEGMAIGIDANADSVTSAIDDMTNSALLTSSNALSSNVGIPVTSSNGDYIAEMVALLQEIRDKENSYSFNVNGKTMAYAIAGDMDKALAYEYRKNGGK